MRAIQGFLWMVVMGVANAVMELYVSSNPGSETIPYQYGIMFEDINHSGEGGIYAELIMNRAFQANSFAEATIAPWFSIGETTLSLRNTNSLSAALPNYVNVAPAKGSSGSVGFANPGWWGISVRPQKYTGSFYVMGTYKGKFTISLGSNLTSDVFATTSVTAQSVSNKWTQINYTLKPREAAPNSNNTLSITFNPARATDGSLNFNLISLFPPTYKDRPNGMRPELMDALSQLSGSYFRMPGGNNIEGIDPASSPRWIWNNTIGPLIDRPGRMGTWGYYNTDGLGLHEYFDWCEDLDLEAVYAVWSGLYLGGQIIAQNALQPYIDEALNAIEYITGNTSTTYGALRAANGRTEPWKLNWVEVGNEDFLAGGYNTYVQYRFQMFYDAIHAAYPDLKIMASFTNFQIPAGALGDYHIYTRPDDFVARYHQSDGASAVNPAMVGEFANVGNNIPGNPGIDFGNLNPWPTWVGSVGEVVYLLGLEVNAQTIFGASYAPTLQNLNSYEWGTNMISFQADPSLTILSTSWHTIKLLSNTRFTQTRKVSSSSAAGPVYWAAGVNEPTGSEIIKLATYNTTDAAPVAMTVTFPGIFKGATANLTVLTSADPLAHNAPAQQDPVVATTTMLKAGANGIFSFSLPNYAVAVLATVPKGHKGTTGAATDFKGFGGYGGCKGGRSISATGNGC